MVYRYVPLIRWKRGEKTALSHLSPLAKANVTPFILLGADNFKEKKATKNSSSVPAPTLFASEALNFWGNNPFFLDASPLKVSSTGIHPIQNIASSVQAAGGVVIPAITLTSSAAYAGAVHAVATKYRQGVALRIRMNEMATASTWVGSLPYSLSDIDLIVDLLDGSESALALGSAVNLAFASLVSATSWRSVTLAGTSIPENFQGLAAGNYTRPRFEAQLWQQISSSGLVYQLDYGDYATVSTATPAPGIAWGYPITVKYTLTSDYLVCRGVRTVGAGSQDMAAQLVTHAKSIANYPLRGAIAHCWADHQIDSIANGTESPKGLAHWVSLSVNRHIELVRSVLP